MHMVRLAADGSPAEPHLGAHRHRANSGRGCAPDSEVQDLLSQDLRIRPLFPTFTGSAQSLYLCGSAQRRFAIPDLKRGESLAFTAMSDCFFSVSRFIMQSHRTRTHARTMQYVLPRCTQTSQGRFCVTVEVGKANTCHQACYIHFFSSSFFPAPSLFSLRSGFLSLLVSSSDRLCSPPPCSKLLYAALV